MQKHKHVVLPVLVLAVVLSACGRQTTTQEASTVEVDRPTRVQVLETTDTYRLVEHSLGEAQVPLEPQRIVAVSGIWEFEALLVLDVHPIAAAGDDAGFRRTAWFPHMEPYIDDDQIERLPSRRSINLEAVVRMQPDLIIGMSNWIEPTYDELSQTAPTVGIHHELSWQDTLVDVARVVDRVMQAEAYIEDYEQRLTDLATRYDDVLNGTTFSEVKSFIEARNEIHVINGREATTIFTRLGMVQAPALEQELGLNFESIFLSLERIDILDADAIFVYHYPTENELQEVEAIRTHPLFREFEAVEQEQIFPVRSEWWFRGPISNQRMVDDLENEILPTLADETR
ncbi:MAG: ABC transporter substrate-binding protein [Chloroflexota bacterium]